MAEKNEGTSDSTTKSGQTTEDKTSEGTSPGNERQADTLSGSNLPQEDQERPVNDPATKSGEYVDISVDTPVNPSGKGMPKPTAATGA